ncbi:hypothetical protein RvY_16563 [Ramazzottius varieornatus]|uniref:Uncharacterized protein n=1 Tax=Ramazzottius varieornatus TaxID=947166 RepID=A0A1D1VZQ4_RAMVA|nr:hypothetical protein RvY_16563 [Ramazzottius varieornatus]
MRICRHQVDIRKNTGGFVVCRYSPFIAIDFVRSARFPGSSRLHSRFSYHGTPARSVRPSGGFRLIRQLPSGRRECATREARYPQRWNQRWSDRSPHRRYFTWGFG